MCVLHASVLYGSDDGNQFFSSFFGSHILHKKNKIKKLLYWFDQKFEREKKNLMILLTSVCILPTFICVPAFVCHLSPEQKLPACNEMLIILFTLISYRLADRSDCKICRKFSFN